MSEHARMSQTVLEVGYSEQSIARMSQTVLEVGIPGGFYILPPAPLLTLALPPPSIQHSSVPFPVDQKGECIAHVTHPVLRLEVAHPQIILEPGG
jgi:hypothetical protein